jgi:hypothetical protein
MFCPERRGMGHGVNGAFRGQCQPAGPAECRPRGDRRVGG